MSDSVAEPGQAAEASPPPFDTTDGMEPDDARYLGTCSNVLRDEHKISVPSVAGPGGLVESGPELHTELSRRRAGSHGIPWQQGRYPKSAASAPNATLHGIAAPGRGHASGEPERRLGGRVVADRHRQTVFGEPVRLVHQQPADPHVDR